MKYGYVKKKLTEAGFVLDNFYTAHILDAVVFTSPVHCSQINEGITIEFDVDDESQLPEQFQNGEEFSYEDSWLEDLDVKNIYLNIDKAISFRQDGSENSIYLHNEFVSFGSDAVEPSTLHLFDKVLSLLTDSSAYIEFIDEYTREYGSFLKKIERFKTVLNKHKNTLICHNLFYSDEQVSNFCDKQMQFFFPEIDGDVIFNFEVLTWKSVCQILINPLHNDEEIAQATFSLDCDLDEFEKEFDKQHVKKKELRDWIAKN